MKTCSSSLPDLVGLTTLISCCFQFKGHKILVTWHSFQLKRNIKLQPLFSIKQQQIVAFYSNYHITITAHSLVDSGLRQGKLTKLR